jgi:hypothetical protein
MKLSREQLVRLYRGETARSEGRNASCIAEETLVDAAKGTISQSERERVVDHLATCSDCAGEYRLIASLRPWSLHAARQSAEADTPERLPGVLLRRPSVLAAAAALLVIVSVALTASMFLLRRADQHAIRLEEQLVARDLAIETIGGQLAEANRRTERYTTEAAQLRRDLEARSQPQLNAPIVDLDSRDSTRSGSAGAPRTIVIPATANVFTLIFNSSRHPAFLDYALEIVDRNGRAAWTGRGLQISAFDTFTVAVPRGLLPAGRYRFTVYGLQGDRREMVEDYHAIFQYK